ncbi:DUF2169 domain-containing protein [Vibrio sp. T187]|uniref:DUF2169 family type VI secretion system accessory protein n=1 Tax=Vibrio TaxID=662 RepID=UPI0010CA07BE|nr:MULTISPECIES: DUF2169 domain-containing protein [Vibrio]MBW3698163.1 DUF2169 domain-containing protein [Vibrio sp. T187]
MQLWDIDSHPELTLKGRFQRDENGNEVWVVTGKRTWKLEVTAWVEQEESLIHDDPVYAGEPGISAMKEDHEFAYFKQNTDVLIYGKARSYSKKPVVYHECRLLLDGHIDKTISVHGERVWIEHGGSLTMSRPTEFIEKEIDYSNAIGGDIRNRIGCGIASSNKELLEQNVPSVFYPKEDWSPTGAKLRTAGFGPVPPFFESRLTFAGTFDEHWEETRRPMLPTDFDKRFYQSAPVDQQCKGYLLGGERMVMSGFCHDDTILFRIPSEQYVAIAKFQDETYQSDMSIYTVFVDSEQKTVSVSYTAAFPCQGREHLLIATEIKAVERERQNA